MNTLINTHSLKIMVDSSIFEDMSRSDREVIELRVSPVGWTLQLRKEMISIRKLEKYTPTKFANTDSTYNKRMADSAVCFINCLKHTKGEWYGQPFDLIDWQEQIVRDIFGILKPNEYRQFNTAYIEIPKKQGKSELAAATALLLTCGDFEHGGEVYGCASDRQQASIVFDVAVDMVEQCPALK